MSLQIRPLTPAFAAEVTGFSMREGVADDVFRRIEAAFEEYGVLVFPDQPVTDEEQIAFSARFGPLDDNIAGVLGANNKLAYISNLMPDGTRKPVDSQKALFARANQFWHSDSSYLPIPAKASLLSARILPKSGGDTEFASTRAAYEALSPKQQAALEPLVVVHWLLTSRLKISPKAMSEEQRQAHPPVRQALVRTNPVTGRKSLLIGAHVTSIDGLPLAEAQALHEELLALAERFTYRHKWRPHDIVMWDNRSVLHRGHPYDEEGDDRRLVRTTLSGSGPTVADGRAIPGS